MADQSVERSFQRMGTDAQGNTVCHDLDVAVGTTKMAIRSTFTSETQGAIMTVGSAIVLTTTVHEVAVGVVTKREAIKFTEEEWGLAFDISLFTDAKNLLAALRVSNLKTPVEKNFLVHVQWPKGKLEKGVVRSLAWVDTRDKHADGHT